jgi:hypothetical protein
MSLFGENNRKGGDFLEKIAFAAFRFVFSGWVQGKAPLQGSGADPNYIPLGGIPL